MSCRVRRPLVAIMKVQQASITLLARLTLNQPALLSEDRTAVLVLQPQAELAETSVQLTISNREMALVVHSAIVSKAYLLQVTLRLMGLGRGDTSQGINNAHQSTANAKHDNRGVSQEQRVAEAVRRM